MHILVTGGAGYIGSHICKELAKRGYTPVTLDNLSYGNEWAVKWGPFVHGDISDKSLTDSLCKKYSFEGVINLAALTNVREGEEIPEKYYANNVEGTKALLDVLVNNNVTRFVQSSTCSVYGIPQQVPIDESHPTSPINTYGKTKLEVEKLLKKTEGIDVALLRYFNAAGADPDGELGEARAIESHLIPLLIETAQGIRPTFTLFGEDHPTPDGTAVRDFIHVTDLAQVHIHTLEWLIKKKKSITFNLGSGKGYSIKEIIQTIEQLYNVKIPIQKGERFAGDPPMLIANPNLVMDTLRWKPKYSDLSTIIQTAWEWHKNR